MLALVAALHVGAAAALAGPPERVVSINLCADQLAMMLAAPGQLVSVSHIAADPLVSVMAGQAAGYRLNRAQAEEIHALEPDLVLAGPYTSRYTVSLLRRLGVEVRELPGSDRLTDIPETIALMGEWLGREHAAEAVIAEFRAGLAALATYEADRPRAVLHSANNYTSGTATLAHQILTFAGFANIAEEAGLAGGGTLPMERLIMLMPDVVISAQSYPGATRAEGVLHHPAMAILRERHAAAALTGAEWVCGTPAVLSAIARLSTLREEIR